MLSEVGAGGVVTAAEVVYGNVKGVYWGCVDGIGNGMETIEWTD